MLFSRIESAASVAGATLILVDSPADLPPDLDLVLVDWSARHADWADALRERSAPRVILFGRHTDLGAHSAAREAKLGPRWARSKLILGLATILHRTP